MTDYPSADDYVRAVQHPARAFADADLQRAEFAVHPMLGVPMPASGSTAVVFRACVEGRDEALRFFIREDASSRDRYTELGRYLDHAGLTANIARARWADRGIRIGDEWFPMIRMQWVEGRTLDRYVDHLVEGADLATMEALAGAWRDLVRRMQNVRFAHGDLQHGNVLVDEAGTLRLVDFDCAWISPFQGKSPPTESGHRNYQRPGNRWGPWMDTFPGLVIYLSLLALSRDPQPWLVLNDEDNLIFRREDFDPPFETAAWLRLAAIQDPQVEGVARLLRACCEPSWTPDVDLEQVLGHSGPGGGTRHDWVVRARERHLERHGTEPGREAAPLPPPVTVLPPPPPKETIAPAPHRPVPRPPGPGTPGPARSGQQSPEPWWARTAPAVPPAVPTVRWVPGERRGTAYIWQAAGIGVAVGLVAALIAAVIVGLNGGTAGLVFLSAFLIVTGLALPVALYALRPGKRSAR